MWCLSRLLPLIIHDLIPEDNHDWELFSDLMKIVDIIITPVIARETTFYLQILIKEDCIYRNLEIFIQTPD